jgi:hypothetical protein
MHTALITLQVFQVAFLLGHDWLPLGRLNDIRAVHAADSRARLIVVTLVSAAPYAFGLAASLSEARRVWPDWLPIYLWISYGLLLAGQLRAWWVPYLITPDPARALRYESMFGRTHAFLPVRNGIRPNTLHLALHAATLTTLVLLYALPDHGW